MAFSWSENNIFTTEDAIKYVTEAKFPDIPYENKDDSNNGGFEEL